MAPFAAGCVQKENSAAPAPSRVSDRAEAGEPDLVLSILQSLPVPTFDAEAAVTLWETYLTTYPKRDWMLSMNEESARFLGLQLADAGYRSETMYLSSQLNGVVMAESVQIVRGVLPVGDGERRLAIISHYDSHTQSLQGAYDNGAGTIAALEVCKLLAAQKERLQHSIDCLFFDSQERAQEASRAYVEWYDRDGRGFSYDFVFAFDMAGINWPGHSWKLYTLLGAAQGVRAEITRPLQAFVERARDGFLEAGPLPGASDGIQVLPVNDRPRDEASFIAAGIPTLRFAGGRHAADYPMYHQPLDTVPYVYEFVGGRAHFEAGMGAVVLVAYYLVAGIDALPPGVLPVH